MNQTIINIATTAAEQLLHELQEARTQTNDWQNEPLGQQLVAEAIDRAMALLAQTGIQGSENQLPSSEFWRVAGELLSCGVLQLRAREKPSGYAGDPTMLSLIWNQTLCDHPLGRLFDHYFQSQQAPCAVRERMQFAAEQIVIQFCKPNPNATDQKFHLVSVGSGAGIDVVEALRALDNEALRALDNEAMRAMRNEEQARMQITLLDLDEEALKGAVASCRDVSSKVSIQPIRENLFRLARGGKRAEPLQNANMLVCLGLLDYLEDRDAVALLKVFWDSILPGGQMIVGNFAPSCTTRTFMEWIGNWYLIYRDQAEFLTLTQSAGISAECCQFTEVGDGADLLLVANKPAM